MDQDRADAAAAAAGDARAFERLYQRHVARIHSLSRRMLNGEEADDVTQEVFVRVWRKLDKFRGDSAFGTWLYRVAINLILGKRSALASRRAHLTVAPVGKPATTRPARVDLRVDFEAALERLPDGARQIFVLHDVEGYTHEEIAGMLQVTTGTSKSQLHRARMTLRQHLA